MRCASAQCDTGLPASVCPCRQFSEVAQLILICWTERAHGCYAQIDSLDEELFQRLGVEVEGEDVGQVDDHIWGHLTVSPQKPSPRSRGGGRM